MSIVYFIIFVIFYMLTEVRKNSFSMSVCYLSKFYMLSHLPKVLLYRYIYFVKIIIIFEIIFE